MKTSFKRIKQQFLEMLGILSIEEIASNHLLMNSVNRFQALIVRTGL